MKKSISKLTSTALPALCLALAASLAGCASTKSISLSENSPAAVISVIGTNLVQWQENEHNDNDENDSSEGALTSLVAKTIDRNNPEITTAVDRLDYADESFRRIVPEIAGLEVLDKDKVVGSKTYKTTRGSIYNALTDSTRATGYKDMSVIGAKKARMLMEQLGAKSLVSMEFNFKKKLVSGTKNSGQAAALVRMKIKFIDGRGNELINKEYERQSQETVAIGGGYYDKDELISLINKTTDELITDFAAEYSNGYSASSSGANAQEQAAGSSPEETDSQAQNVAPTKLGKPKSTALKEISSESVAEKTAAEEAAEQKAEETARNLLKMNLDVDKIAEATGLSVERVKELQAELK